jgi:hypothetical protein
LIRIRQRAYAKAVQYDQEHFLHGLFPPIYAIIPESGGFA